VFDPLASRGELGPSLVLDGIAPGKTRGDIGFTFPASGGEFVASEALIMIHDEAHPFLSPPFPFSGGD
jgi:hypothetical protein